MNDLVIIVITIIIIIITIIIIIIITIITIIILINLFCCVTATDISKLYTIKLVIILSSKFKFIVF